ncbi:uncharacterized protein LOC122376551 [Amphibalanus amphitrite]|uniref:uncharacterized protein LOC122376551 n=1 Tax=Amphibalanus amphitrite TaxID=1232801 RepID=UPI001C927337|nr:uncharacterized protein LOC122376551 [Amphibalanus amphitrite]
MRRPSALAVTSQRRRCVPLLLVCLPLGAVPVWLCMYRQLAEQHSPAPSGTGGGDTAETLVVPVGRLVEPSLPAQSWFAGDPSCAHLVTQFGRPGSLPDARIASFPRSGNTWVRYLLEAATGLVTCGPTFDSEATERRPVGALPAVADVTAYRKRSLSTSAELSAAGFIAEHVSPLTRTCLAAKTHVFPPVWRRVDGPGDGRTAAEQSASGSSNGTSGNETATGYPLPAILLVRDPFPAIIALRHLLSTNSIRARAGAASFSGAEWRRFVEQQSQYWLELADEWAEGPRHTLLVPFERLVAEPAVQLRRILRFLGVTPAPERLGCALRHKEGAFRNTEHPVLPREEVYDADMRRMVWSRIRLLDDTLSSRGYRQLPLQLYSFYKRTRK